GGETGAMRAMALEVLAEWRLASSLPAFGEWLGHGAPSDDVNVGGPDLAPPTPQYSEPPPETPGGPRSPQRHAPPPPPTTAPHPPFPGTARETRGGPRSA